MAYTLYKARGMPLKQHVCAICVDRTRGKTQQLHLGYGVSVWLCQPHASVEFTTKRGGRDFVLTLSRLWGAHQCLTKSRSRALDAHLAALRERPAGARPGSYAWPKLRLYAERMFATGSATEIVIDRLGEARLGPVNGPSNRTVRRWKTERRWRVRPP